MKNGPDQMGFVTGEADGVITLRNIAGQVSKIKRDDVKEEKHLPQSMMPAGLAAGLTVEEFTSLVEYLGHPEVHRGLSAGGDAAREGHVGKGAR
jgi:putative heme-binding domain-containing protein